MAFPGNGPVEEWMEVKGEEEEWEKRMVAKERNDLE